MKLTIRQLDQSPLHFLGEFAHRVRVRSHVRFPANRDAKRRFEPGLVETRICRSSIVRREVRHRYPSGKEIFISPPSSGMHVDRRTLCKQLNYLANNFRHYKFNEFSMINVDDLYIVSGYIVPNRITWFRWYLDRCARS